MDHPVFINNQHIKTEAEMQRDLNKAAKLFQRYAEEKILFIYASDKNSPMEAYETFFGSENFMHLCGYKIRKEVSGYKAARDFYKTCLYGVPEEFKSNRLFYNFTNSRKETSAKIDALLNLLDYRHVKLYKIGPKRATTISNEFEVGIGTNRELMGFSKRGNALPVPVTVVQRPLTDYVFEQKNVIAVLQKRKTEAHYKEVTGCITRGIETDALPDLVKRKISPDIKMIRV